MNGLTFTLAPPAKPPLTKSRGYEQSAKTKPFCLKMPTLNSNNKGSMTVYSKPAMDLKVQKAIAAERERCAEIADEFKTTLCGRVAERIALLIRAQSE